MRGEGWGEGEGEGRVRGILHSQTNICSDSASTEDIFCESRARRKWQAGRERLGRVNGGRGGGGGGGGGGWRRSVEVDDHFGFAMTTRV